MAKGVIEWTLTDDDSYQWQGDYGDGAYEMLDLVALPDGNWAVAEALIDLDLYDECDKAEAMQTFGYDESDMTDALMAEILFEEFELFCQSNWELFDNRESAEHYIDRRKSWCQL